jgi:hypothetical protein
MTNEHDDQAAARLLVDHVDEMLREQQGLDAANRETLLAELERALLTGGIVTSPVDPERVLRDLEATLGGLQQSGAITAEDQDDMLAAFEAPLQDAGVQRALEFARRCQHDGETSARAWLATQGAPAPAVADNAPLPPNLASAIRRRRSR